MNAGVSLRTGTAVDAQALLVLWRAAGAVLSITEDVESIERLIARDPEALVVAERDGALVGSIVAGWDGWRGCFYRLAVHPDHQRLGIARALVVEGERRLKAQGARRIAAIVMNEHAHATGFWGAAGYRRDERVGRFIRDL